MQTKKLEVAVGDENRNLFFAPLDRIIRLPFDFNKCRERLTRNKSHQFPHPMPGQKSRLDITEKRAEIIETLHDEEHAALREQIEQLGMKLPPQVETFDDVHVDAFLHYLEQSVEAGHASIRQGEFPKQIGKPKSLFSQPTEDPRDKTIERLTAILYAQLTLAQQKQVQEMVD